MEVSVAIEARSSFRAFLDKPVSGELVESILVRAGRAPSGGNLQPWHVCALAGEELSRFKQFIARRAAETPAGEQPELLIYPEILTEPYRTRRFKNGEDLYATIGIPREDRDRRLAQLGKNFEFFSAPVGLLFSIDRGMNSRQWLDLGCYLQSVMLLAFEAGLGSCPQAAWARWHRSISQFLELPGERMPACGMALGYPDERQPINGLRTDRAVGSEFVTLRGF